MRSSECDLGDVGMSDQVAYEFGVWRVRQGWFLQARHQEAFTNSFWRKALRVSILQEAILSEKPLDKTRSHPYRRKTLRVPILPEAILSERQLDKTHSHPYRHSSASFSATRLAKMEF